MIVKDKVTLKDIKEGVPYSTALCPVARVIRRHIKVGYMPIVSGGMMGIRDSGRMDNAYRWITLDVPANIKSFIRDFDNGIRLTNPIDIEVEIPDEYLK